MLAFRTLGKTEDRLQKWLLGKRPQCQNVEEAANTGTDYDRNHVAVDVLAGNAYQ